MATEGEEDLSDEQESETEDCYTEEVEGKINFYYLLFLYWSINNRQDQVEEWAEDLHPDDKHPSHGGCLHHLPRPTHVPSVSQVSIAHFADSLFVIFQWTSSCSNVKLHIRRQILEDQKNRNIRVTNGLAHDAPIPRQLLEQYEIWLNF